MSPLEIKKLFESANWPGHSGYSKLIETHVSWVLVGDEKVLKIKKPVNYGFLNFESLAKRKFYCGLEVALNSRLAPDIYLGVLPIRMLNDEFFASSTAKGEVVDYAVVMNRIDEHLKLDHLLEARLVGVKEIKNLVEVLVPFHRNAVINYRVNPLHITEDFKEIVKHGNEISQLLGKSVEEMIETSVSASEEFVNRFEKRIRDRIASGFFRDGHGDLHTGNVFYADQTIIFDCIEFNPAIRQVDLLNELAFMCMDLDVHGYEELSNYLIHYYNVNFQIMENEDDELLFTYYKAYRAGVRAKVIALSSTFLEKPDRQSAATSCENYLNYMTAHMKLLVAEKPVHK